MEAMSMPCTPREEGEHPPRHGRITVGLADLWWRSFLIAIKQGHRAPRAVRDRPRGLGSRWFLAGLIRPRAYVGGIPS